MENVQDQAGAAADVPVAKVASDNEFEYTNTQPFATDTAQYAEYTTDGGQDIAVDDKADPATDPTLETTPGGEKVKKLRGEKRKYRNPAATRPPTFTGAVGEEKIESPQCHNCQSTVTPLWRRGPAEELLCNACGLFFKLHKKMRPSNLAKPRVAPTGENAQKVECNNCGKTDTPMWRKEPDTGKLLCNACALYRKLHGTARPEGTTQGGGKKRRRNKVGGGPDDSIGDSSLEHVHGTGLTSLSGAGTGGGDEGQIVDQAAGGGGTVPWDEGALGQPDADDGGDIPAAPPVAEDDGVGVGEERTANIHPDFRVPTTTGDQDLAQQAAAQYLAHANSGGDIFTNTEGAAAWNDVQDVGGSRP